MSPQMEAADVREQQYRALTWWGLMLSEQNGSCAGGRWWWWRHLVDARDRLRPPLHNTITWPMELHFPPALL